MRAVIQRVSRAKVTVQEPNIAEPITTGEIDQGLLVLIGIGPDDGLSEAQWLAKKLIGLRIFEDEGGKMNLSVQDIGGAVLAVSQFTLFGDCRRGRRPSFTSAAHPSIASPLFDQTVALIRQLGVRCEIGKFGHHMEVSLVNDGPVTLLIDTDTK
jgi:D-aminoacyl-tRNA deacylase